MNFIALATVLAQFPMGHYDIPARCWVITCGEETKPITVPICDPSHPCVVSYPFIIVPIRRFDWPIGKTELSPVVDELGIILESQTDDASLRATEGTPHLEFQFAEDGACGPTHLRVNAVHGTMTLHTALNRLLAGTGCTWELRSTPELHPDPVIDDRYPYTYVIEPLPVCKPTLEHPPVPPCTLHPTVIPAAR